MKSYKNTLQLLFIASLLFSCSTPAPKEEKKAGLSTTEILCADQIEALYNEGVTMADTINIIASNGKKVNARELFTENTFVLSYSSIGCSDCIQFAFQSLLSRVNLAANTILLVKNAPLRDLHVLKKEYKVKEVCKIDSLPFPFGVTDMPFCFVIDKELHTRSFFIPRKEIPQQTDMYMNFIENNLLKE